MAEEEITYEIVYNEETKEKKFFPLVEMYIKNNLLKEADHYKNRRLNDSDKEDIRNLILKEFEKGKIQNGTEWGFSVKKTQKGNKIKITISNVDNFLKERVRKGLDAILPRDSQGSENLENLETLILGTFPGVKTLNENSGNPNICYYLDSNNIFRLMLGIIYDDRFENGDNPAIKTYLNIGKKGKSKEIAELQQAFVNKIGTIGIWDAVHICYITPLKSTDNSRICLVPSGLDKLNIKKGSYKILFNGRKNKLHKFVDSGKTFDTPDKKSEYIHCSSTSGSSSSGRGLRLFEWSYNLLINKNNNLIIINKSITKILKKYFKWAYRILLNRHHNKITNQLNIVNKNLIRLIKKYKTEGNEDFVKTLYSMMALFNIGYAYEKNMSYNKVINYVINKFEKEEKDKLSKNFKKELIKKLTENVKSFLTGKMDDEDDKKNNENDDIK